MEKEMKFPAWLQQLFEKLNFSDDQKKALAENASLIPVEKELPNAEDKNNSTAQPIAQSNDALLKEMQQMRTLMEGIVAENNQLKAEREAQKKALEEKAKSEHQQKVEKTIHDAITAGKIGAKDEAKLARYKGLLEKDFDSAKAIIDELPSNTKSGKNISEGNKTNVNNAIMPGTFLGSAAKVQGYVDAVFDSQQTKN